MAKTNAKSTKKRKVIIDAVGEAHITASFNNIFPNCLFSCGSAARFHPDHALVATADVDCGLVDILFCHDAVLHSKSNRISYSFPH